MLVDAAGYISAVYDDGTRDEGYYVGDSLRFGQTLLWVVERRDDGFRARTDRRSENFKRTSGVR